MNQTGLRGVQPDVQVQSHVPREGRSSPEGPERFLLSAGSHSFSNRSSGE